MTRLDFVDESMQMMILDLKNSQDPIRAYKTVEFYLWDHEYDIEVTVRLTKKKSQLQIGMEMFHGKAR